MKRRLPTCFPEKFEAMRDVGAAVLWRNRVATCRNETALWTWVISQSKILESVAAGLHCYTYRIPEVGQLLSSSHPLHRKDQQKRIKTRTCESKARDATSHTPASTRARSRTALTTFSRDILQTPSLIKNFPRLASLSCRACVGGSATTTHEHARSAILQVRVKRLSPVNEWDEADTDSHAYLWIMAFLRA